MLFFRKEKVNLICVLDKECMEEFNAHLKYDAATNDEYAVELVLDYVKSNMPI